MSNSHGDVLSEFAREWLELVRTPRYDKYVPLTWVCIMAVAGATALVYLQM